jgi:hypothetical protein
MLTAADSPGLRDIGATVHFLIAVAVGFLLLVVALPVFFALWPALWLAAAAHRAWGPGYAAGVFVLAAGASVTYLIVASGSLPGCLTITWLILPIAAWRSAGKRNARIGRSK